MKEGGRKGGRSVGGGKGRRKNEGRDIKGTRRGDRKENIGEV